MRDIDSLLETLHPLERAVIPVLEEGILLTQLTEKSGLQEVEVVRALQWLENKGVLERDKTTNKLVSLDIHGTDYLEKGLPERRFLQVLEDHAMSLQEIQERADLNKDELHVSLGLLKKKEAITVAQEISITEQGKTLLVEELLEEQFLQALPLALSQLTPEQEDTYTELKKRKRLIKVDEEKTVTIHLTELGEQLIKADLSDDMLETVTPNLLKTQGWKDKKFRRYDVEVKVPNIYYGKRHFVNQAFDYARKVWTDMGFQEMHGTLLQSSFWNFDALFTPQDHPVREMQDTFFVQGTKTLADKDLMKKIKQVHENGGGTGSIGWGGSWDQRLAEQLVLRTHTTCLSVQTLARLQQEELPAKFFSVGRVFRNEAVDWAHLFEFNQTEGIVVGKDLNFRHLLGYLKTFFHHMGFEKVRFRPGYFPYTEMSVEPEVYHPVHKKWIELGGSGIFRPEVVEPLLGKDVTVLAWGLGLDRIITDYYDIKDLRDLFRNDLKQLREMKFFLK